MAKCNQRAFDKIVARPVISAKRTSRIQRGKSILGSIAAGHTQSAEPAAVRTIKSVPLFMNPTHREDSRIERSTKESTRYRNPVSCSELINGLFRLRAVLVVSRPSGSTCASRGRNTGFGKWKPESVTALAIELVAESYPTRVQLPLRGSERITPSGSLSRRGLWTIYGVVQ